MIEEWRENGHRNAKERHPQIELGRRSAQLCGNRPLEEAEAVARAADGDRLADEDGPHDPPAVEHSTVGSGLELLPAHRLSLPSCSGGQCDQSRGFQSSP